MPRPVKTSRRYESAGRQEQARQTRREVLAAAKALFLERGYAATTMADVAAEAGVAVQTVYSAVGGKAALLKAVFDTTIVGDDERVPVSGRPEIARVTAETDGRRNGIAYHCYGLELKTLAEVFDGVKLLRAAYPNKSLQETECTQDGQHIWPSTIDTLIDHARRGANSIANWNLALDPQGGPHSGLCSEVRNGRCYDTGTSSIMTAPVVISGPAGHATATFTREYYEMGQFTKFVRPGAVRIASTESPNLNNVAFRNPDGSKVLIVHNLRDERTTFAVNTDDDHHFDVDLRANAIATLTW